MAASGIRIIHENATTNTPLESARALISGAHRVCFLGFGYHRTNLERLGIPATCNNADLYGSAVAITPREADHISALFNNRLKPDWRFFDCLSFLRENTPLD